MPLSSRRKLPISTAARSESPRKCAKPHLGALAWASMARPQRIASRSQAAAARTSGSRRPANRRRGGVGTRRRLARASAPRRLRFAHGRQHRRALPFSGSTDRSVPGHSGSPPGALRGNRRGLRRERLKGAEDPRRNRREPPESSRFSNPSSTTPPTSGNSEGNRGDFRGVTLESLQGLTGHQREPSGKPQYRACPGVRGNGIASRTLARPVT